MNINNVQKRVWKEYEEMFNEEYSQIVRHKVSLIIELLDSLSEMKIQIVPREFWVEPMTYKLCYHATSILDLFNGTTLPYKKEDKEIIIFDEPSMLALLRTFIENYLTFFYLFIEKITEDEKEFRFLIYKFCGVKQRSEFEITDDPESEKKQELEKKLVVDLQKKVEESILFKNFPISKQKQILKGRKPRLFNTWPDIIKSSGLRSDLFGNMYGYKSNYSHSEFISILQIKEGQYGHHRENSRSHHNLFVLHMLLSKTICELSELFPFIDEYLKQKDFEKILEIKYLNQICTNTV